MREGHDELGYLAVDVDPENKFFVVYELWVPLAGRRRGIGSFLLRAAEDIGRSLGYGEVLIRPKTMSKEFSQAELEAWYLRNGYSDLANAAGKAFVKLLRGGTERAVPDAE